MKPQTLSLEEDLAEGLRHLTTTAERHRHAAAILTDAGYHELELFLLSRRLEELAKALFILEYLAQDPAERAANRENAWPVLNTVPFPWLEAIPPQPGDGGRKLDMMARAHPNLHRNLLHVGRGNSGWIAPTRFGDPDATRVYRTLGDTMTRRIFDLIPTIPELANDSAQGEIPRPSWLDARTH